MLTQLQLRIGYNMDARLKELHELLKNALGNIKLKDRIDAQGLSLPIEEYSFIESDSDPSVDNLPKYAELTGLVTRHPDYDKMQNILQELADGEQSSMDLYHDLYGSDADPDHTIHDKGFNEWMDKQYGPTGIANPAEYMSSVTKTEEDTNGDGNIDKITIEKETD